MNEIGWRTTSGGFGILLSFLFKIALIFNQFFQTSFFDAKRHLG
jgi:hypothetical protein